MFAREIGRAKFEDAILEKSSFCGNGVGNFDEATRKIQILTRETVKLILRHIAGD